MYRLIHYYLRRVIGSWLVSRADFVKILLNPFSKRLPAQKKTYTIKTEPAWRGYRIERRKVGYHNENHI